jgi:uncharacterized membrane protein
MTEGPTPREPRDESPREPSGPEAPSEQPPPAAPPPDATEAPRWESTPPDATEAPRWEAAQPPPPDPGAAPPPPPPGDHGWGQQAPGGYQQQPPPGGYQQQPPGGYQQPGGYQGQPGGWQQQPGGHRGQPGTGAMAENVASGLSYVFTWITGLIFYLVDRRPEVRFHAMQSIVYGVLWTLVAVVRPSMPGPLDALLGIVLVAFFVGWVILLIQGFQGRHFKLPVIGDFAEQQAGRPGL